jgi:hypothetical protein
MEQNAQKRDRKMGTRKSQCVKSDCNRARTDIVRGGTASQNEIQPLEWGKCEILGNSVETTIATRFHRSERVRRSRSTGECKQVRRASDATIVTSEKNLKQESGHDEIPSALDGTVRTESLKADRAKSRSVSRAG